MMPTPKLDGPAPRKKISITPRAPRASRPPARLAPPEEPLVGLSLLAESFAGFELWDEEQTPASISSRADALQLMLIESLELLRALERDAATLDDELGFESVEDPETQPNLLMNEPVAATIADVCFAGTLELSRAAVALRKANSPETSLIAAETALRKAHRVSLAVLEAAQAEGHSTLVEVERLRSRRRRDLGSALAVRRLYAEFRRALRVPDRHDAEAVLTALRYAAGALATLTTSSGYAGARASDRSLLRRLRERLLGWARGDREPERGLQLLEDAKTCADLLRSINRRQELRAHDAALVASLLAAQDVGSFRWHAELEALGGLDDELDRLLEQFKTGTTTSLEPILQRLESLR